MKNFKVALSFLICCIFFASNLSVSAISSDSNTVPVFLSPSESALFDTSESHLIATQTYTLASNEHGVFVRPFQSYYPVPYANSAYWDIHNCNVSLFFYENNGTYHVAMSASLDDYSSWFIKHRLEIRPTNSTGWDKNFVSHNSKPQEISDGISFRYPNGAPTDISVQVKTYFSYRGDSFFQSGIYFPTKTLNNPA